jgi:hypothetical protein
VNSPSGLYSGWPNAISAVTETKKVFDERDIAPVTSSEAARAGSRRRGGARKYREHLGRALPILLQQCRPKTGFRGRVS